MKLTKLLFSILLTVTLTSCGSKNNIFYDGSDNSDVIGNILPVEATPDFLIQSPLENSINGKSVTISGQCADANTVEISNSLLAVNPTVTNCTNERFTAVLNFTNSTNEDVELIVKAKNSTKESSKTRNIKVNVEVPSVATHIDVTKTRPQSVELDWNPASSSTIPLQGYILEYKRNDESTWSSHPSNPINALSAVVENLTPSTLYDFRIKSFNGNSSDYSTVSASTTPQNDFFEDGIKAFNVAGATESSLVAIEDGDFYLNGNLLATLTAGQTHQFNSAQFDKISSQSAFYVAGKKTTRNGSVSRTGNMVWLMQDWADKNFSFSASRSAAHQLSIVAFEDANVVVKRGTTIISTQSLLEDQGVQISLPSNANYTIESTGIVSGFLYSSTNNGQEIRDPRPLLPNATDLIGIPSRQGFASAMVAGTEITGTHSNDSVFTHTFTNLETLYKVIVQGTPDRYKSEAVRIKATNPIEVISNADYDGWSSAPFLPRAKMKTHYGVNVEAQWVAFVSVNEGSIKITKPDGTESTLALTRSGTSADAPYKARIENLPAGTLFESDVKMGAWYEPKTDSYGANDDETILYGYEL